LDLVAELIETGHKVKTFDPAAMGVAKLLLPKEVQYCKNPYEAAQDADAVIVLTEWDEFKAMELGRIKKALKNPLIIDGRNIFDPVKMRKLGFRYISIGR